MTKKQIAYKKSLLKLVHLSYTYKVFFADNKEGWRNFLYREYGVESSKDLSIDELKHLVDYLNNKTNKLVKPKASDNQVNYILNIWALKSEKKDIYSLLVFAKRILRKELKSLDSLRKREAIKLIAALNNLKRRG